MIHVYLMPGMSANSLIFERIKFPENYELHYLNWISPKKDESIQNYAIRFSSLIKNDEPVMIGVSMASVTELTFSWFCLGAGMMANIFAAARGNFIRN